MRCVLLLIQRPKVVALKRISRSRFAIRDVLYQDRRSSLMGHPAAHVFDNLDQLAILNRINPMCGGFITYLGYGARCSKYYMMLNQFLLSSLVSSHAQCGIGRGQERRSGCILRAFLAVISLMSGY